MPNKHLHLTKHNKGWTKDEESLLWWHYQRWPMRRDGAPKEGLFEPLEPLFGRTAKAIREKLRILRAAAYDPPVLPAPPKAQQQLTILEAESTPVVAGSETVVDRLLRLEHLVGHLCAELGVNVEDVT